MANYTITSITWTPNDAIFQPLTAYSATVVLTAGGTYAFVDGITPVVNAGTASIGRTNGDQEGNTLTFTVSFPITDAIDIPSVQITGFIAPATGETPVKVSDLTAAG